MHLLVCYTNINHCLPLISLDKAGVWVIGSRLDWRQVGQSLIQTCYETLQETGTSGRCHHSCLIIHQQFSIRCLLWTGMNLSATKQKKDKENVVNDNNDNYYYIALTLLQSAFRSNNKKQHIKRSWNIIYIYIYIIYIYIFFFNGERRVGFKNMEANN